MARDMRGLSTALIGDRAGARRQDVVVGELLWATLRGLVMAQMLSPIPIDSSRERALLVDLITGLLNGAAT
jgi:hypothetical protein